MNLPKRDGVNGRYYLIHKPDTDPEVLKHADQCIQDVWMGRQKRTIPAFRRLSGTRVEPPFFPTSW